MKDPYRLVRRGGVFYAHDRQTQLRTSLQTSDRTRANQPKKGKEDPSHLGKKSLAHKTFELLKQGA